MSFFESFSDFGVHLGPPWEPKGRKKRGELEVLLQEGCLGTLWEPILDHFGRIWGRFFTDVWGTLGEHLGTGNPKECQRNTEEKTKK